MEEKNSTPFGKGISLHSDILQHLNQPLCTDAHPRISSICNGHFEPPLDSLSMTGEPVAGRPSSRLLVTWWWRVTSRICLLFISQNREPSPLASTGLTIEFPAEVTAALKRPFLFMAHFFSVPFKFLLMVKMWSPRGFQLHFQWIPDGIGCFCTMTQISAVELSDTGRQVPGLSLDGSPGVTHPKPMEPYYWLNSSWDTIVAFSTILWLLSLMFREKLGKLGNPPNRSPHARGRLDRIGDRLVSQEHRSIHCSHNATQE
jgi:hypothetical protein